MGEAVKEEKIASKKLYYSISEVSKITGVKQYVLRFWEKEFPSLRPKKNRSGNRIYQKKEIDLIQRIKKLLYEEGYTIEGARQRLKNSHDNPAKRQEAKRKVSLATIKAEIKELIQLLS